MSDKELHGAGRCRKGWSSRFARRPVPPPRGRTRFGRSATAGRRGFVPSGGGSTAANLLATIVCGNRVSTRSGHCFAGARARARLPGRNCVTNSYDALLIVSFGGPERADDVVAFLEDVVRGKNVPRERILEVAEHYYLFGGESPINAQLRALLASLIDRLNAAGPPLPVYWGNRHWHPRLVDTLHEMADDGIGRALAFVTSAYGSHAGCREYLEAIERARAEVGPNAPQVDKLRLFYNHPAFVEAVADRAAEALARLSVPGVGGAKLVFTAHSLPLAMARQSAYEAQLAEACRLVAERLGRDEWCLCYQSRSGPPTQAWLEPDLGAQIVAWHEAGQTGPLVLVPIGFLLENMELVYDLDVEIGGLCEQLGVEMVRAAAVGNHPRLAEMIRLLVEERLDPTKPRLALGEQGPSHDTCPADW
ncbi:MAG: ferrochelatase [Pirellulales bacterium]|nr:ferrochelatase [Pirellulales bacterium]